MPCSAISASNASRDSRLPCISLTVVRFTHDPFALPVGPGLTAIYEKSTVAGGGEQVDFGFLAGCLKFRPTSNVTGAGARHSPAKSAALELTLDDLSAKPRWSPAHLESIPGSSWHRRSRKSGRTTHHSTDERTEHFAA